MDDIAVRHGPKPGLKKQRPIREPRVIRGIKLERLPTLPTRRLSDFPPLRNLKPSLTWLKIHHPNKGYKLVWEFMGRVVYCGENQIVYKNRGRVITAGQQLANLLGTRFKE